MLKGLDVFKVTPKTNCQKCGFPTCMAFSMKVVQESIPLSRCPYLKGEELMKDQMRLIEEKRKEIELRKQELLIREEALMLEEQELKTRLNNL